MSANIIVFDSQYTAEVVKNIEKANGLIDDAVNILKHARSHRLWQCPEVSEINNSIETLSSKLKRLDRGLSATANALNRGQERFSMLETRSQQQADKLSEKLREKYGFSASVHGKNETTNLPVTEIPRREDNFIIKALKGTAKNIIQGLGTAFGTVIGFLSNGINKAGEGFLTDVKEALIDPMINIFKGGYQLGEAFKHQSLSEAGSALATIATNSVGLIASVAGLGSDFNAVKNLDNLPQGAKLLNYANGRAYDFTKNLADTNLDPDEQMKNIEIPLSEGTNPDAVFSKMITDSLVPFGLDETLIQGVEGAFGGAKDGAKVGYNLATMLCNFLGL